MFGAGGYWLPSRKEVLEEPIGYEGCGVVLGSSQG
jgi:hypothetical protein